VNPNRRRLGGRPVRLIIRDEGTTPQDTLDTARKLIGEEKVDAVLGVVNAASALAIRDLFHESKTPLVIVVAGANDITRSRKSPYVFRVSFSNWQVSYSLGRWVYRNLARDDVVVMVPDFIGGHEIANGFADAYTRAGGKISETIRTPFGQTQDFQPYLSRAARERPKAIFAFYPGVEAVRFIKQYDQFGLKERIPLVTVGATVDEGILEAEGSSALGVVSSYHYSPTLANPLNRTFSARYTARFKELPSAFAVHAYDAARLLDLGLRRLGKASPSNGTAFARALSTVRRLPSPRGTFEIDARTRNPVQHFYLRRVRMRGGRLMNVAERDLGVFRDPG
jgi:branched-chain amino acid transport system substrate-binding protein